MSTKSGRKKVKTHSAKPVMSINAPVDILKTEEDGSITGVVEEIVYRNELNGYTVFYFATEQLLITCTGILPDIGDGDRLSVYGDFETNPKYGRQFKITDYRCLVPNDAPNIESYLASGAIKGIGPKTAARIVAAFGEATADVIENNPEYLAQIQGITVARAREISKEFMEKSDIRAVMNFFREYLGPSAIMKAYHRFGKNSIEVAKNTPYRFCDEIDGITFEVADGMAKKLNHNADSPERLASGIKYVLNSRTFGEGHTCLYAADLIKYAASTLGVSREEIAEMLERLVSLGILEASEGNNGKKFIQDRETAEDERYIAAKLVKLCGGCALLDTGNIVGLLRKAEAEIDMVFGEDQRKAIVAALSKGTVIISGGPGTGKTTVINALSGIFESMGFKVALCAPTGRAAKRMTEATGREAKTVHRLLEVSVTDTPDDPTQIKTMEFRRNETNLLDEHIVIVDEASMLDTPLMSALLKAVKPGSRLILIGDADQLPSVGIGNVLRDCIDSGTLPVITLTHIFRQAEQSLIVTNAHAINRGEMPDLSSKSRDFFFLGRQNDTDVMNTVADLCVRRLPNAYGENEVIQVITPSRKGCSGTEQLNIAIQENMNPMAPGKREHRHGAYVFRTGDKVMQVRNNYLIDWEIGTREGQGIFNGDIGIIKDINTSARYFDIDFEGRRVIYEFKNLDDLEPAYAITVHKAQGSEYSTVVLALGDVPYSLQTRNLLYTAVTRAKSRVVIVGYESTVFHMVNNLSRQERYTRLCENLRLAAAKK